MPDPEPQNNAELVENLSDFGAHLPVYLDAAEASSDEELLLPLTQVDTRHIDGTLAIVLRFLP